MCMCVDIVLGVCAVRCSNIGQLLCSENYGIGKKKILSYVRRGTPPEGLCVEEGVLYHIVFATEEETQHMAGHEQLEQINTHRGRAVEKSSPWSGA